MRRLALVIVLGLMLAVAAGCDREEAQTDAADSHERAEEKGEPAVDEGDLAVGELVELLEADEVPDEERLEAIHRAREARVEEAAPQLRELLRTGGPDIVVAAAAALERIDADGAESAIVAAAERLSRTRQYEHLRQLLYILGDLGGTEARVYLEAVADGHEVPPIRRTAADILERE